MPVHDSSCLPLHIYPVTSAPLGAGEDDSQMYYQFHAVGAEQREHLLDRPSFACPSIGNVQHTRAFIEDAYLHKTPNSALMDDIRSLYYDETSSLVEEECTLHVYIDRALLDLHFDLSCLEALDDQLLHDPVEAFAEVCWEDAVDDEDEDCHSSTIDCPQSYRSLGGVRDFDDLTDETRTDSVSCLRWRDTTASFPIKLEFNNGNIFKAAGADSSSIEISTSKGRRVSFDLLTPPSAMSDPKYSIHYFPTSPRKRPNSHRAFSSLRWLTDAVRTCLDLSKEG